MISCDHSQAASAAMLQIRRHTGLCILGEVHSQGAQVPLRIDVWGCGACDNFWLQNWFEMSSAWPAVNFACCVCVYVFFFVCACTYWMSGMLTSQAKPPWNPRECLYVRVCMFMCACVYVCACACACACACLCVCMCLCVCECVCVCVRARCKPVDLGRNLNDLSLKDTMY